MQNGLLIAIIAGLGAMVGWGISDFFAKKSVDKIGPLVSLFWMQIFGLIPLILIFFAKFSFNDLFKVNIYQILILGVVNAFGYLMIYKAFKKGEVSIISPIISSYSAFSVLFAAFYFKESLSHFVILCLIIIVVGIILSSLDYKKIFANQLGKKDFIKGLPEALLAIIILSIWFPFWGNSVGSSYWFASLLLLRFFFSLALLALIFFTKTKIVIKDKGIAWWLVAIGFFDVLAYISLTWGYSISNYKSIITVLASIFAVPTIILARIFLKEKLQIAQIIGIIIIIAGVASLAFIKG